MLENMSGIKVELKPVTPKENEKLCDVCGGIGWLYDKEKGFMERCACYGGVIHLCPLCQQPRKGICMNNECRKRRDAEEEQKSFNKAIKAKYEDVPIDHKKMMYSKVYPYNEGYFHEIYELVEYCESEGITVPAYVWSTEISNISMDAGSIIENACEELHDEAYQNISKEDEEELQDFLNAWCARQTGTATYTVDYKNAIMTGGVQK